MQLDAARGVDPRAPLSRKGSKTESQKCLNSQRVRPIVTTVGQVKAGEDASTRAAGLADCRTRFMHALRESPLRDNQMLP